MTFGSPHHPSDGEPPEPTAAPPLRVALFTDCLPETNGVGTLCRELVSYARRRDIPLLCAFGGSSTQFHQTGSVGELQFRRGPFSFALDAEVRCDPFLFRHIDRAVAQLREFRPDLVHITGPGDLSILGFWAAHRAGVPVMGSWHTNLHEYAERRLQSSLCFLPGWIRNWLSRGARDAALWAMVRFYRIMHFLAAPNQEMVEMLERRTGRASFLMAHGADTTLFAPERRERTDDTFTIGYVGRLTPEKNVRAMAELERSLVRAGTRRFRIVMVGGGTELPWLKEHVRTGEFPGVLRGVPLARQFANMDAFVFPSLTDTFGLVILEAMSSRVPVVLPPETGLRAGVMDGVDGYLSRDFAGSVQRLMSDETTRQRMATAAREHALARNWPGVFDDLYRIYGEGLDAEGTRRRLPKPKF